MNFSIRETGTVLIIYLNGLLDLKHINLIEDDIIKTIQSSDKHILLNLKGISHMSSSGLRLFVSIMRLVKKDNRNLKICNNNTQVNDLFKIIHIIRDMFEIYDSEQEALQSFADQFGAMGA